jgi:hypothetical protein
VDKLHVKLDSSDTELIAWQFVNLCSGHAVDVTISAVDTPLYGILEDCVGISIANDPIKIPLGDGEAIVGACTTRKNLEHHTHSYKVDAAISKGAPGVTATGLPPIKLRNHILEIEVVP